MRIALLVQHEPFPSYPIQLFKIAFIKSTYFLDFAYVKVDRHIIDRCNIYITNFFNILLIKLSTKPSVTSISQYLRFLMWFSCNAFSWVDNILRKPSILRPALYAQYGRFMWESCSFPQHHVTYYTILYSLLYLRYRSWLCDRLQPLIEYIIDIWNWISMSEIFWF